MIKNKLLKYTLLGFAFTAFQGAALAHQATLYKDPNCGCCVAYAEYLESHGYEVKQVNHPKMDLVKKQFGTHKLASCHTMKIGDYVVEGHVPVAAIEKMLAEQPDIQGITLPGMPYNSPGMGPEKKGSLDILAFNKGGSNVSLFINL